MGNRDKKSKEKKSRRDRSPESRSKSRRREKDEKSREDRHKKSSKRIRRDKDRDAPRRSKDRRSKEKKSRSQSRERRRNRRSSKKSSRSEKSRDRSKDRKNNRGEKDERRGGGRDDRRGHRDENRYSSSVSNDFTPDDKYGKETEEYYEYENFPDRWNQVHAAHKVSYALSQGNRTSDEGGNRRPVIEQPRRGDDNKKVFKFRTVGNLTRQASRLTRHYEQEQQYGEEHDGFEDDEFYRGANTSGPNSRVPSQHASNHNSQYGSKNGSRGPSQQGHYNGFQGASQHVSNHGQLMGSNNRVFPLPQTSNQQIQLSPRPGFGGQIVSPANGRMQQLNLAQGNLPMHGQFQDPRLKLGKSFRKVMFLNRLFYRTPSEDDKPVKVPSKIQPSSFAKSILKKTPSDFSSTSAKSNGDSTNGEDTNSVKSCSKSSEKTEKLKSPGEILKPGSVEFERKVLKSLSDEFQSRTKKGREWNVDLFNCCDFMDTCTLGIIPCLLGAELAEKISEPVTSFFCCAGVSSIRTKFRTRLSIVGDACEDCALSFFCCCCVICQLINEVEQIQSDKNKDFAESGENDKTIGAVKAKESSSEEDDDDSDEDSDDSDEDDSDEDSSE